MAFPGGRADGRIARRTCLLRSTALNRPNSGCGRVSAEPESASLTDIVFDPTDMDGMVVRLEELRARHRELDRSIEELEIAGSDDIKVMGLKREKLRIKDRIAWFSAKITPDIIA